MLKELRSEEGYARINIGAAYIISKYDYIIHTINLREILEMVIKLQEDISSMPDSAYKHLGKQELNRVATIVRTLAPKRSRRGLINIGGSVLNTLWGTMDDTDRQNIEEHERVIDENNRKLIEAMNHQIQINDGFNKSFMKIKEIIENDRRVFMANLGQANDKEELIREQAIEQYTRIELLRHQLEIVQNNLVLASKGGFDPAMLTEEEIDHFKIDSNKLQGIRLGVLKWENENLSLVIKVPAKHVKAEKVLVVPIPNSHKEQILEELETLVYVNGTEYTFEEGRSIFELRPSKNCILENHCKIVTQSKPKTIEIQSDMLIATNMENVTINGTCMAEAKNLVGHYFITYSNCSFVLLGMNFANEFLETEEVFILSPDKPLATEKVATFEEIILTQNENLKEIKELHFHKITSTTLGSVSVFAVAIISIVLIVLCRKQASVKVQMTKKNRRSSIRLRSLMRRYPPEISEPIAIEENVIQTPTNSNLTIEEAQRTHRINGQAHNIPKAPPLPDSRSKLKQTIINKNEQGRKSADIRRSANV